MLAPLKIDHVLAYVQFILLRMPNPNVQSIAPNYTAIQQAGPVTQQLIQQQRIPSLFETVTQPQFLTSNSAGNHDPLSAF